MPVTPEAFSERFPDDNGELSLDGRSLKLRIYKSKQTERLPARFAVAVSEVGKFGSFSMSYDYGKNEWHYVNGDRPEVRGDNVEQLVAGLHNTYYELLQHDGLLFESERAQPPRINLPN